MCLPTSGEISSMVNRGPEDFMEMSNSTIISKFLNKSFNAFQADLVKFSIVLMRKERLSLRLEVTKTLRHREKFYLMIARSY